MQANASILNRFVSPHELSRLTGLSLTTLWRLRRAGRLPEPVRLSPGRCAWSEDTIQAWLEERRAGGDAA